MRGRRTGHRQSLWTALLLVDLLALIAVGCGTVQDMAGDGTASPDLDTVESVDQFWKPPTS